MKSHFVSIQQVKENTSLDQNIDEKYLINILKSAEEIFLQELLSSTLFNKLVDGIATNTLTDKQKTLVQDYILDYLYAVVEMLAVDDLILKITNYGVYTPSPDHTTQKQKGELTVIKSHKERAVLHFAEFIKRYISDNFEDFKEYVSGGINDKPKTINNFGFWFDDNIDNQDIDYNRRRSGNNSGMEESV
jgi:hypothetical protein